MGVVGLFSRQLFRTCGLISSIYMCETELRVEGGKKKVKKKNQNSKPNSFDFESPLW